MLMDPIAGAIEAYTTLAEVYDTYILSTAPWKNPSAWSDKLLWVQKQIGAEKETPAWKRVILSHHKHLNKGAIIIDDRIHNGVHQFEGIHIRFGSERFPDWATVTEELLRLADSGA
ncbi:5' nucleotidase, NT5C type [Williamsia sp. M5A3_1d]